MSTETRRLALKEFVEALDARNGAEDFSLFGGQVNSLANSPKFQEIISILHEQPLLVQPTLEWLKRKRAEMARAQLNVLYTPEQLEEMSKQLP